MTMKDLIKGKFGEGNIGDETLARKDLIEGKHLGEETFGDENICGRKHLWTKTFGEERFN